MKRRVIAMVASMLLVASPAMAGPPLLCFPYQIGTSKSLPWGKDAFAKSSEYDASKVVGDTVDMLKAEKSALVRMETIRRATLYIGEDSGRAGELVTKLLAVAKDAESAGKPDAAAWFNAGFAAATLVQNGRHIKQVALTRDGPVGYEEIKKALAIAPDDAAMQFGAALVAFEKDRESFKAHMKKALGLVEAGSDLAKSMESNHALGNKSLKDLKAQYSVADASPKK